MASFFSFIVYLIGTKRLNNFGFVWLRFAPFPNQRLLLSSDFFRRMRPSFFTRHFSPALRLTFRYCPDWPANCDQRFQEWLSIGNRQSAIVNPKERASIHVPLTAYNKSPRTRHSRRARYLAAGPFSLRAYGYDRSQASFKNSTITTRWMSRRLFSDSDSYATAALPPGNPIQPNRRNGGDSALAESIAVPGRR